MASATPLQDIEENFLLCPVCLDLLKEPKILGCLHRYCKCCLDGILKKQEDVFECPMCKQTFTTPEDGVDGYKTDFHIKSVVEFIELQKSFESKEAKRCIGCMKIKTITAYCFKCNSFLCAQCHGFHLDNQMIKDHKKHILDLGNVTKKKLTLDKLAALREIPRCHLHEEHPAQLCCCSCGNVPVCVACTFGQHRGHDLHEVSTLAQAERGGLKETLTELEKYRGSLYAIRRTIAAAKKELEVNVARERKTLKLDYEKLSRKIGGDVTRNDDIFRRRISEETKRSSEACRNLEVEMERELQLIKEKYAERINDEKVRSNQKLEQFEHDHNITGSQLAERTNILDGDLEKLYKGVDDQEKEKKEEIQMLSLESEQILQRYETFTKSASIILSSKNDWTDVQYIADIRAVSGRLKTELAKMNVPAVKSVSLLTVDRLLLTEENIQVEIAEEAETVVDIKNARSHYISGVEGCEGEKIVVTSNKDILFVDMSGNTVHRCKSSAAHSHYYSCSIPPSKVAVARAAEVKIIDVRDYSCTRRDIANCIPTGFHKMDIRSLAYDSDKKQILLGMCGSRKVPVIDDTLCYSHTVVLPQQIEWPHHMIVHRGKLIVCDESGGTAYILKMEGSKSVIESEFTKPDNSGSPLSVCTDALGFIYMVWSSKKGRVIVQYSQNGLCRLTIRPVDNAQSLATLQTEQGSKLLIAIQNTKMIYIYGLVRKP